MNLLAFDPSTATPNERKSAQVMLAKVNLYHGQIDGIFGPRSTAALHVWQAEHEQAVVHAVLATSFADPADIEAYHRAKGRGLSDAEAFKVGDNGVGYWGDDTTQGSGPACALPPDDWKSLDHPRNALVRVEVNGASVLCRLRDTMPARSRIENGAGIDLNPDACDALDLKPPVMVHAAWSWAQ